ncbi:MAG: UDP-N-acetylmuramate dehydrogenase [Ruminococcaceae bacterium]|nr:UDP-N-acetylmuramate dehydrogenase [Oscillospiraceae bacterium]
MIQTYKGVLTKNRINFKEDEPLSLHSTFRIGGNAKVFVMPSTEEQLSMAVMLAITSGIRYYVIGKGSNIVFPDEGFDGAVISTLGLNKTTVNGCTITAGAGTSFTELAVTASKSCLTGLEFAYGIPGSLGGAVFMNAGAYDGEISFVVSRSRYFDTDKIIFGEFVGDEHCFGYRESIYKKRTELIITNAELSLSVGQKEDIDAKMNDFITRRREKQPLEYPSAGSAFKRYPGRYTAQMIDEAGLKGFSIGGAQVSEKHAGFIINKGGATAADVRNLSEYIKNRLFELHNIEIESEIIFVK